MLSDVTALFNNGYSYKLVFDCYWMLFGVYDTRVYTWAMSATPGSYANVNMGTRIYTLTRNTVAEMQNVFVDQMTLDVSCSRWRPLLDFSTGSDWLHTVTPQASYTHVEDASEVWPGVGGGELGVFQVRSHSTLKSIHISNSTFKSIHGLIQALSTFIF